VGLLERIENRVEALASADCQYAEDMKEIKEQINKALDELREEVKRLANELDRRVSPLEKFREPFVMTRRILLLAIAGLMASGGVISTILLIRDRFFQ
jgi:hypothetical protein